MNPGYDPNNPDKGSWILDPFHGPTNWNWARKVKLQRFSVWRETWAPYDRRQLVDQIGEDLINDALPFFAEVGKIIATHGSFHNTGWTWKMICDGSYRCWVRVHDHGR